MGGMFYHLTWQQLLRVISRAREPSCSVLPFAPRSTKSNDLPSFPARSPREKRKPARSLAIPILDTRCWKRLRPIQYVQHGTRAWSTTSIRVHRRPGCLDPLQPWTALAPLHARISPPCYVVDANNHVSKSSRSRSKRSQLWSPNT